MDSHKEWVKEIFDRTAPGYGEEGCSFFNYFGERLVELVHLSSGEKILDVATGKGAVLFPAARFVGEKGKAIGIDISSKMIEEAQKMKPFPWIELQTMDAEHLQFPDHTFDVVFCAFALFFFSNLDQALSEFKRILIPGGRLAVSVFNQKAALDLWINEKVNALGVKTNLSTISLEKVSVLQYHLHKAGFTTHTIQQESRIFWHENGEAWWNSLSTHGIRSKLEQLSPDARASLKKEALAYAGKGRIPEERHVTYVIAHSPISMK